MRPPLTRSLHPRRRHKSQFYEEHAWLYQPDKIEKLAISHAKAVCFVAGFAGGESDILSLFARRFFLSIEADELPRRLMTRTNGPFADASQAQRANQVQRVLPRQAASEQNWLSAGLEKLSSDLPLTMVAEELLTRCELPPR